MSPFRNDPPRPAAPLLCRWICGCVGLPPRDDGYGIVIKPCDGNGITAGWRWCRLGVETHYDQAQSETLWQQVESEGAKYACRYRATEKLAEALRDAGVL